MGQKQIVLNSILIGKLGTLGSRIEGEELASAIEKDRETELLKAIELLKEFLDMENEMFKEMQKDGG